MRADRSPKRGSACTHRDPDPAFRRRVTYLLLLLSTATSLSPLSSPPSPSPMPSPSTLPPSRYVGLCGVRLTNPPLNPVPRRSPRSPCCLPIYRSAKPLVACTELPHIPPPPLPGRLQSFSFPPLSLRPPPSCRPTSLRFARLRSLGLFSLPRPRPSLALSLFPPFPQPLLPFYCLATPDVTPFGQPAHTRKPCAARNSQRHDSFAIIFCPIVCRTCMYVIVKDRGGWGEGPR